jgi:uncharacterized protein with GYD domain
MPQYLGRFSYTTDVVRALVSNPQDRGAAAAQALESLGGKLVGFWFAFGEFDGVFIADAPDNTRPPRSRWRSPEAARCRSSRRPS